jgi:D-alanyl-D-alanine carboxypeptidase
LNDIATQRLLQTREAQEDGGRTHPAGQRGRQPAHRPVQTFWVASQTKAFVATIVLQLVAEGRVGLDAPDTAGVIRFR